MPALAAASLDELRRIVVDLIESGATGTRLIDVELDMDLTTPVVDTSGWISPTEFAEWKAMIGAEIDAIEARMTILEDAVTTLIDNEVAEDAAEVIEDEGHAAELATLRGELAAAQANSPTAAELARVVAVQGRIDALLAKIAAANPPTT